MPHPKEVSNCSSQQTHPLQCCIVRGLSHLTMIDSGTVVLHNETEERRKVWMALTQTIAYTSQFTGTFPETPLSPSIQIFFIRSFLTTSMKQIWKKESRGFLCIIRVHTLYSRYLCLLYYVFPKSLLSTQTLRTHNQSCSCTLVCKLSYLYTYNNAVLFFPFFFFLP